MGEMLHSLFRKPVAELALAVSLDVPSCKKLISSGGRVKQRWSLGHPITDVPKTRVDSFGEFLDGLEKGVVLRCQVH